MADDGSAQSKDLWPLPKFSFVVTIGGMDIVFQEVAGLNVETQEIEFRAGNSKTFSTVQMPGIKKYGNITLKKGLFKDDKALWSMYNNSKLHTSKREAVTIILLDEKNNVAMSWTLLNAYPIKLTTSDMKADTNDVNIETIELAHEGLSISNS